jgi:FtsP/CotA-like multicopper oxidase with cupredoxin domain
VRTTTAALLLLLQWSFSAHAQRAAAESGGSAPGVRQYYIAAEEVTWNYAPRGRNLAGIPHPEIESAEGAGTQTTFLKAVYREYTDATFSTPKPRDPRWEHLGILGPLIRAEVGDLIKVTLKNRTKLMCSMHAHGLQYDKASEGALYKDGVDPANKKGSFVPPGGVYTYTWFVPERSGPASDDGSSVLWMYHGHFMEAKDVNTGLIGPILINARGSSKPDGTPIDVDREFITAFAVFDESSSWYFEANLTRQKRPFRAVPPGDPVARLPFLMYTINGLIEGNLPALTMKTGERVRWYMFASSNDEDVHTPHWHGQTVLSHHMRTDTIQLTPMGMATADMIADNPGTWLFHCHNNDHFEGGMVALFTVLP